MVLLLPPLSHGTLSGNATSATTATNAEGLTGTPDITVNNITGVAATFTGILTYEDVTNVDSTGIVTAKSGLNVVGGGATVTGVSTFFGDVSIADKIIHTGDTNTAILFLLLIHLQWKLVDPRQFVLIQVRRLLKGTTSSSVGTGSSTD